MSDEIDFLTIPEVAERLALPVGKVYQLLRDGALAAVRRDGVSRIPADFVDGNAVVRGLQSTLTVLHDEGYSDEEAVRWLFTPDDSLPGMPIQALRENRGRAVRRRAQVLGF
ncbi:MAG TPA: Rv2175c family DNA-binding protein [Mycobacteriales bacterium]|nr:Rv2175c family DNA-binding protein [Mycobacteriales bacterium]